MVLPPIGDEAEALVARLDAVVLSGGGDVSPSRYGDAPHPCTYGVDPCRDQSECALIEAADERGLPILAICRGIQMLNVARRGTLHQHLPDLVGHEEHSGGRGEYTQHPVTIAAGTRVAAALGPGRRDVATHHHQAIDRLGHSLVVTAWAEDGTIEAVEDPTRFVVAVQWHPELDDDHALFEALVGATSTR